MQKIYLKKYKGSDQTEVVVSGIFDDRIIKFEGDDATILLLNSGLPHPTNPTMIAVPEDGQLFIDAMIKFFDSPYLYVELENN